MKRYTLCKLCLCILLLIGIITWIKYLPDSSFNRASGKAESFDNPILVCGQVTGIEEKISAYHQKQYILSLKSVTFCNNDFQKQNNLTGALCYLEEGESLPFYGEWVVVSGRAEHFPERRNQGAFDASFYYRTKGLEFLLKDAIILKRSENYDVLSQQLFLSRQYLREKLNQICDEDAGIMQALLLGDKVYLSKEIKKLYQKGGISHVLAISGLHISLIGAGLYRLLRKMWIPISIAAFLSGGILLAYGVMTGASPSTCRAVMMFLFCLLADVSRRSYERRTALAVSAVVQIIQNPMLFGQSGFWLSYGAVLGLEMLASVFSNLEESKGYKLFAGSISVFLVTLPILLVSFYEFPMYSFLLNLLVIPLMSVVMAVGILALVVGIFWLPLGKLLFFPVHIILCFFKIGCQICIRLPGNQWIIGKPEAWRILLYILLIFGFLLLENYLTKASVLLMLLGAVWILTGTTPLINSVTMLDVGQGDGIVIQDKSGHVVMIDGGSSSEKSLAEYTIIPYLKSQGISEIDCVFLTHMDIDHTSGIEEILRMNNVHNRQEVPGEVKIKTLVLPKLLEIDEKYMEIIKLAQNANTEICVMERGEFFFVGEMQFYCMHPEKEAVYADKNAASLVLYMQMEEFSALFMGDLDGVAERELGNAYPKGLSDITLLKVGHHGAADSCQSEFLQKINPVYAAISCGKNNSYGHPAGETVERLEADGAKVFCTRESGQVTFEENNGKTRVKQCLRESP